MYIKHHGIKGQKWGVRNGPPYPIEDKVLKKGTRLNSVSSMSDSKQYRKNGKWMYTYNPDDEWDNKVYKGPFTKYKMGSYYDLYNEYKVGKSFVNEHQFEVVKDLKMPSSKERIDTFIDVYNKNVKAYSKELSDIQSLLKLYDVGSKGAQTVDLTKLETDKDYKHAYEIFNHAMEANHAYAITRAYSKIMSKNYDAMVDDNNQGVYNRAHDPIIIFRADKALKEIGSCRALDMKEIVENYEYIKKELAKKGENVKL